MYQVTIYSDTNTYQMTDNADLVWLGLLRRPIYSGDTAIHFYLYLDGVQQAAWDRGALVIQNDTLDGITPRP